MKELKGGGGGGGGQRERELRETSSSIVERERERARAKEVEQLVGKRRCCCVWPLWKSLVRGMRRRSVHSSCRRKLHLSCSSLPCSRLATSMLMPQTLY